MIKFPNIALHTLIYKYADVSLHIVNAVSRKDRIHEYPLMYRQCLCLYIVNQWLFIESIYQSLYTKKDFRRDRRKGVRDRGCATGRQSEGKVELLYPHRSADRSVSWPGDRHLVVRIAAMIFQPPLPIMYSPFRSLFFPQGVAFNRPGCSPAFSLPAFR